MMVITYIVGLMLVGFLVAGLRGAIWVPARTKDTAALIKKLPVDTFNLLGS